MRRKTRESHPTKHNQEVEVANGNGKLQRRLSCSGIFIYLRC